MANEGYHEPIQELSDATRDMHRAIISLMEELEAVDWYNQRVDACKDDELKAILAHNRDEEKEHASMVLEWIRRNDPSFCLPVRQMKSDANQFDYIRLQLFLTFQWSILYWSKILYRNGQATSIFPYLICDQKLLC